MSESVEHAQARLMAAQHAMQSGVAGKMTFDGGETEPKHLRVGVNAAMVGNGALAKMLIAKGIITEAEYFTALADAMEAEKQRYADYLSAQYGTTVTLS